MQTYPAVGQISPDGLWRWDGVRWSPTGATAAPSLDLSGAAIAPRRWSRVAIAGGVLAILGVPVVLAACIVPFIYWTDTSNGASSSVFDLGYGGGFWYAIEPVAVILLGLAAAVVLIAAPQRVPRAVAAGALIAFGLQTMAMFLGYAVGDLSYGRMGPGGPIGALGGVLLFGGGALGVASVFSRT